MCNEQLKKVHSNETVDEGTKRKRALPACAAHTTMANKHTHTSTLSTNECDSWSTPQIYRAVIYRNNYVTIAVCASEQLHELRR